MTPREEIAECERILAGEKKTSVEERLALLEKLYRPATPQQSLELPRQK